MSFIEENDQTQARRDHLARITALVGSAHPTRYVRSRVVTPHAEDTVTSVHNRYIHLAPKTAAGERATPDQHLAANSELNDIVVRIAGRLAVPPRVMGKAAFVHLSDGVTRLQIYVRKDETIARHADGAEASGWELFNLLDHGDFIGVQGHLFITKTGELSVHVGEIEFLAKSLQPMPDKLHGINDPEVRQRRRYLDLLAGSLKIELDADELTSRDVFERRALIVRSLRRHLDDADFTEVETPMLAAVASGAAARPFATHHNALDIPLYLRIAPELYLKRLLVGGFERVYELNRNFRNEGLSIRHNPEFTMLEFYAAYWDSSAMMDFAENLLRLTMQAALADPAVKFGEHAIDFARPFERMTMRQAIVRYFPDELRTLGSEHFDESWLDDPERTRRLTQFLEHYETNTAVVGEESSVPTSDLAAPTTATDRASTAARAQVRDTISEAWQAFDAADFDDEESDNDDITEAAHANRITRLFETLAESELIQPTFITDFPRVTSPLAKASANDSQVADRFELFIGGMEVANGFSELNDPEEQQRRFVEQAQAREHGDDEAMILDEDYIHALTYGMPPAAGIGIGIDRLVMLACDRRSIRDVILFPHMRPAKQDRDDA